MFVQIEEHRGKVQGGLGIGLSLVHSLVHMHGGMVEVHSPGLGQGSEFIVRLPLLLANPDGPGKVQGGPEEQAIPIPVRRRILVVDDSRDSADSLGVLVQALGHEVRTAYDGPSALALLRPLCPTWCCWTLACRGWMATRWPDGWRGAEPPRHPALWRRPAGGRTRTGAAARKQASIATWSNRWKGRLQTLLEAATRTS